MPARLDDYALIQELRDLVAQFVGTLSVGHRHLCAVRLQEERGGNPRLTEAHDQNAFAFEFQTESFYLSLSVVNANRAKIRLAIQKRTMTFDSDQPNNSK